MLYYFERQIRYFYICVNFTLCKKILLTRMYFFYHKTLVLV